MKNRPVIAGGRHSAMRVFLTTPGNTTAPLYLLIFNSSLPAASTAMRLTFSSMSRSIVLQSRRAKTAARGFVWNSSWRPPHVISHASFLCLVTKYHLSAPTSWSLQTDTCCWTRALARLGFPHLFPRFRVGRCLGGVVDRLEGNCRKAVEALIFGLSSG